MNVRSILPTPAEIGRETLIVIGGIICAAVILSRFPALKEWIANQGTVTLKDEQGRILW
ncbi:hypothetical protein K6V92_00350 [Cupriavidus respiraculi]|uniref:hypothetical protein n=1 Tax=Cupriavidus respiraculi TaxID=195930 RepID=UPI001C966D68|nr:hypothetical protein [Cupriavidus respiraculi]MBY4945074.1 hypothetical protein [Cupriavidus respiraculi]